MSNPQLFEFDAADLARALQGDFQGPFDDDDDDLGPSDELQAVARRIAGNHVDVVASFIRMALGGEPSVADHHQFAAALTSLARLAEAAGDEPQRQLLTSMRDRVEATTLAATRQYTRFKRDLRDWVGQFAGCLDGADANRLHELVEREPDGQPLLAELANLRGIGPKRLEKLYACGLFTVEVTAQAVPSEVAAVTGMPVTLARDVVEAARQFALKRREVCVAQIRARTLELGRMLAAVDEPVAAWMRRELSASADDLTALLAQMHQEGP